MSETLLKPDVGDAELITAVRGGDVSAYGTLFERHVDAARRLARQLTSPSDADDLVSDAFAKVLRVLQNGGGPDLAFRAYLLTAVRRLHVDKIRAGAKLQTTDDLEKFDPGVPFRDTAVEGFENSAAAAAFASLPERWQLVLWHTEVEGQKPAEVAELLGMSANSVSALAYRAREGLRQAYLNSHIGDLEDAECRWTHDHLGPYIRNGVSKRDGHKVEEHLDGCRKCMAIYLELTEVNSNLSGILAPIILGGAASGYLASGGAVVKAGFLATAAGRVRDGITSNVPLSAAIGVAAVSTVVGVSVAISMNQGGSVDIADAPRAPAATSPTGPGSTDPDDGTDPTGPDGADPDRRTRADDGTTDPSGIPDTTLTDPATGTTDAAGLPSDGTTDGTTSGGTDSGSSDNPGGGNPGGGGTGGTGGPTTNHPPVTQPEFDVEVPQGERSATIPISQLVQDEDGDDLRFVDAVLQDPAHGELTIGSVPVPARGTAVAARTEEALVYVAERGWGGRDLVSYRVTDGDHTVSGSFRISTVNDAPVANDEDETTPYGVPLTVDLLENDTDPDGDPLTLSITQLPENGTITRATGLARLFAVADDEGVVTYTPDPGWSGPDTVTYLVDDGHHQEEATLTVTTGDAPPPVNRAPEAVDDDVKTAVGQPVTYDVIFNDKDLDGDPLHLVSAALLDPKQGEIDTNGNEVTYRPEAGFVGTATISYVVEDDHGARDTGTLRVAVEPGPPVNRAPEAVDDDVKTAVGQPVTYDVIFNDKDLDDDPLHLVSAALLDPKQGEIDTNGNEVTYRPEAGFVGTATISYVVEDDHGARDTGTLRVAVEPGPPVNRAPEAVDDDVKTAVGQPVTYDVIVNDKDLDDDPLHLVSAALLDPKQGEIDTNGNEVTYRPEAGFVGTATISYVVEDDHGARDTGTLRVAVEPGPPVNRAPQAVDDDVKTAVGQPVTYDVIFNDKDLDDDPLHLVSAELLDPKQGEIDTNGNEVTYRPEAGFVGTATISYVVEDDHGARDTGTLRVTVERVNNPPTAVNDVIEKGVPAKVGGSVRHDVLANDTDPDGDELSIARVLGAHRGTVTIDGPDLVFTYDDDFAGDEEISYVITDGQYESTGTLSLTVLNEAPVAKDDTRTEPVKVGDSATIAVLANDTDPNGDALTLVGVSTPANGTATVQGDAIVYTPDANAKGGPDTFTYTVRDARGGQATAQVRVTVAEPQYDVAVAVIQGERDDRHADLTARITGYPDQGGVRLEITGQAVNAIVGGSLPASCDKVGGDTYRCDLTGLTGERRDVDLEVRFRGQERGLRFAVGALDFEELPGTGANNAADWS